MGRTVRAVVAPAVVGSQLAEQEKPHFRSTTRLSKQARGFRYPTRCRSPSRVVSVNVAEAPERPVPQPRGFVSSLGRWCQCQRIVIARNFDMGAPISAATVTAGFSPRAVT